MNVIRALFLGLALILLIISSSSTSAGPINPIKPVPNNEFSQIYPTFSLDVEQDVRTTHSIATATRKPKIRIPVSPVIVVPTKTPKPATSNVITRGKTPSVSASMAYALKRIGAVQYSCLYKLWNKESGWDPLKYNYAGSGAYGIPQALPGSKMAVYGADWRTNPLTQVKWGIHYVNSRYGSACKAWAFWQIHGWY